MLKQLTLIFLLIIGLSSNATANEDKNTDQEDMGTITVEEESEARTLTHSPIPVSVIEMEKFHGRNISLNEVLKRVAGVKIRQEGGLGSRATIAIHGLEGKRVKVFIDGNPLNAPDGTFGINDIPIQLIERIEVYKGVVPARFGGDALGGAVNVVTRDFKENYIDLTASAGSYNTRRGTFVFKKNFDEQKMELGVGGFYNSADNNYEMDSPFVDGLKIKRDHDRFLSYIAAIAGSFKERWFDEIEFELVRYESEKEIQGIQTVIKKAKTKSRVNLLALAFEKENFFIDNLEFEYDIAYIDLTLNFIDKATTCHNFDGTTRPCSGAGGEVGDYPRDSDDKQIDLRHDLNLHYLITKNYGLNFHLNIQNSKYRPKDELANESLGYDIGAFPSEKTNTVMSLGLESSHLKGAIVNDFGLKWYRYDFEITSQERSLTGEPAQSQNDGFERGWYESIRYEALKDLFIKASYEHAFRLPDSEEVFGDGVTITSAPELQPEEADNFNLGVLFDRYDFHGLPWVKAEFNYFYKELKNLIKLEYGIHTAGYVNQGEVEVKGFETEVQLDINDHWYMYANYTKQTLKDVQKKLPGSNADNPTYNHDLPNVPKEFGNYGIEYKMLGVLRGDSLLKLFWETNWADEYFYGWELSKHQDRKIEAQVSHTAGFDYSFNQDLWIIGFEVRNLTDEEITDVFNYPLPGRTYHINVRYSWFET